MSVLGVDLSLTSTGWAYTDGDEEYACGLIATKGSRAASLTERHERIDEIVEKVLGLAFKFDAELVVIEGPSMNQKFAGSQHDRSGLWWIAVKGLIETLFPVAVVPPTNRAKYATGKGNAGKDEVLLQVSKRLEKFDVYNNDTADAATLCAMGMRYLGKPIDDMPESHTAAMEKVQWPT